MKIREGAYYRTRGGDVVGPMRPGPSNIPFCWETRLSSWDVTGAFSEEEKGHDLDLISEVYVSDTPPDVKRETEAELREMMRDPRYWRAREPEFVKRVTKGFRALVGGDTPPADVSLPDTITDQPIKTLRDEFAMQLMKPNDFMVGFKEHAEQLYRAADAMMEARKK